jgi:hypothetical protein
MTLYILKYNNYYNRILKREINIQSYLDYEIYSVSGINFNPNDGVNTTHILGGATSYSGEGDYLLITDDYNNIVSRWFIIDAQRVRAGQYSLTLRRDLFVDYWDKLLDAPAFIEKAILPDSSPLIFNSENMTFNQIKTGEVLIKDKTQCPWVVGYYSKTLGATEGTIDATTKDDLYDIYTGEGISFADWTYNATETPFILRPTKENIRYFMFGKRWHKLSTGQTPSGSCAYDGYGNYAGGGGNQGDAGTLDFGLRGPEIGSISSIFFKTAVNVANEYLPDYFSIPTQEEEEYFLGLRSGMVVKDGEGKYYQITIEEVVTSEGEPEYYESPVQKFAEVTPPYVQFRNSLNETKQLIKSYGIESSYPITGEPNGDSFGVQIYCRQYKMTKKELNNLETKWNIKGERVSTIDAPYDIFAMPLGKVTLRTKTGTTIAVSNPDITMPAANSIIKTLSDNLYDIQLLPYCPVFTEDRAVIEVSSDLEYSLIRSSDQTGHEILDFILNVPRAQFSRYIKLPNSITWYNKKIDSQCNLYKLCSPNWAAEFEISPTKNDGIYGFDVDCEYKPFQPYIHIAPNFAGFYGRDFNDARGLICSGDFSLSQTDSKWQEYQLNNKNFQTMFDREIQNMEVQHRHQRIQQGVNILSGSLSGVTKGAVTGAQTGGGYGAIVGGVVGGATSVAGGLLDYSMSETLRNEALDYKQDMFGYQLDNIKALPYTLTKVSAYNPNNKIFPVLEYYTCTDTEKIAFANKIAYNSMSVGVIGTISDYLYNSWQYWNNETQSYITDKGYIKGQLIRLDDFGEDFHVLNALAEEFNKGVYTK